VELVLATIWLIVAMMISSSGWGCSDAFTNIFFLFQRFRLLLVCSTFAHCLNVAFLWLFWDAWCALRGVKSHCWSSSQIREKLNPEI
jgi:hypothetical protein